MRPSRQSKMRFYRAVFSSLALAVFVAALPVAEAKTRHKQRRSNFAVALQPFSLVHSAVHAVAEPLVANAPRVALAVTAEPIRLAYYARRIKRTRPPRPPRGEPVDVLRAEAAIEDGQGEERDAAPAIEEPEIEWGGDRPTVGGTQAVLRNGIACAPSRAPANVQAAIWAVNTLRHKPYVWGGGHGSFSDRGYDCSGTVSFALHHAGLLATPMPSSDFLRYGERGRGHWITIYSRPGHTFAVIAGLRLDTTDFRYAGNEGPRWHVDGRDTRGFEARHPAEM